MGDTDQDRWNRRYRDEPERWRQPAAFLLSLDALLPRRGRALDVAGGAGRNGIWLAARGLEVTLVDVSDVAVARARQGATAAGVALDARRLDLCAEPLPTGPWDLITCFYYLHRPLFPAIVASLRPGGLLVVAHATRTNLERHRRPGPHFVLEDGELPGLVAPLCVLRSEEGWLEAGKHEARLVARRDRGQDPEPPV